jgi:hypothetical protein
MNKYLVLFLVGFFVFASNLTLQAQRQYNYNYSNAINQDYYISYDYFYFNGTTYQQRINDFDSLKVKKMTVKYTNKKGRVFTTFFIYDHGKIVESSYLNKKGVEIKSGKTSYDPNSGKKTQNIYYNKKGDIVSQFDYKYDENKNITFLQHTKKSKTITFRSTWEYNESGMILNSKRYKKGGEKIKYTWNYIYDNNGEKLQSQLFNSKGKLKHKWDFSCHEEGAKLEKEKNKTQVCSWSEDKGKYLIKTYQSFNEKGKIRKTVYTYTISDTTLIDKKIYNHEEELIRYFKYDSKGRILERIYYRNGKTTRTWIRKYNDDGKMIYNSFSRKEKQITESKFEYKNGLLVSRTYNRKGKLKSRYEYTHYDNGLLKSVKAFNHKNELINSTEYIFEFK